MSLIANDYIPKINGDPPSIKYGYIYNWFVVGILFLIIGVAVYLRIVGDSDRQSP